jgi:hypothetical protein
MQPLQVCAEKQFSALSASAKPHSSSTHWKPRLVHPAAPGSPPTRQARDLIRAELVAHFREDRLSRGEFHRHPRLAEAHRLLRARPQMHLDALLLRAVARFVMEVAQVEIRASSRLMRASRFRLKAAVTPAASSYAASSRSMGFTRSVPSSRPSPGHIQDRSAVRNSTAASGSKFPIVLPRNSTSNFSPSPAPRCHFAHSFQIALLDGNDLAHPVQLSRALRQRGSRDVDREVRHLSADASSPAPAAS